MSPVLTLRHAGPADASSANAMTSSDGLPILSDSATTMGSSTANGVLIGLLSSFGSAVLIALIFVVVYFFRYTQGGRILLDRIGRPGEYDDEQAFLREEAEALEEMEEGARVEYLRAKGRFISALLYLSISI
jgi:hypothetical protein